MSDNNSQAVAKIGVKEYLASPGVVKRTEELLKERAGQFIASIASMVSADNKLAECEPASLFMACLTAASLDLPINKNLAFAHIIPYKNNNAGVTEAQFQLGWRGYVQLAQRSGQYKTIAATEVYEGQLISEDPLAGNTYDWKAKESDKVIGYVAMFILAGGFEKELYMSIDAIKRHADRYSKAYNHGRGFGPWKDNFDAMALKTVVKLLISKWGPMSVEMQKAVQFDQGVIKEDESVSYIDGDAMSDVNATEEKKNAIIEAHKPGTATKPEATGNPGKIETTTDAPTPDAVPAPNATMAAAAAPQEPAEPEEPAESVKDKAARKYGPKKQAKLV